MTIENPITSLQGVVTWKSIENLELLRKSGNYPEIIKSYQCINSAIKAGGKPERVIENSPQNELLAYLGITRVAEVAQQTIAVEKLTTQGTRLGLLEAKGILDEPIAMVTRRHLGEIRLNQTQKEQKHILEANELRDQAWYLGKVAGLTGASWALEAQIDTLDRAINMIDPKDVLGKLLAFEQAILPTVGKPDFEAVSEAAKEVLHHKQVSRDQMHAVSKWHWRYVWEHRGGVGRLEKTAEIMDKIMGEEERKYQIARIVGGNILGYGKKVGYKIGERVGTWKNDEFKLA